MIILKKLTWSNWFSYGDNNCIVFNNDILTQLIGINGSGKSSIQLILEEILFGKNSKGIKKQELVNRNNKNKGISAKLIFSCNYEYTITLNRKSTISLKLEKDGKDISSHTATKTYAEIERILGVDFKTFSQLIYQSSTSGLQFLTTTDSQRKVFLINLFNLQDRIKLYTTAKETLRSVSLQVAELQARIDTNSTWLQKEQGQLLIVETALLKKAQVIVPNYPVEDIEELANLKHTLEHIKSKNKRINENNTYKEQLKKLNPTPVALTIQEQGMLDLHTSLIKKHSKISYKKQELVKIIKRLQSSEGDTCQHCLQPINKTLRATMLSNASSELATINKERANISKQISDVVNIANKKDKKEKEIKLFEQLYSKINQDLESKPFNIIELPLVIEKLAKKVDKILFDIKISKEHNEKLIRIKVEKEHLIASIKKYKDSIVDITIKINKTRELAAKLEVLKKAFSTTGLIAYKLESLVKSLEHNINKYLSELSDGAFLINFSLVSEKLIVSIINNGVEVNISSLSSGQLARVNTATLLAMRSLMSAISKNKINLLFLDEIMGVLDQDGKDKLIEILLGESDLNTFVVSHDYTHPLLSKITVSIEKEGSKIKYGRF